MHPAVTLIGQPGGDISLLAARLVTRSSIDDVSAHVRAGARVHYAAAWKVRNEKRKKLNED